MRASSPGSPALVSRSCAAAIVVLSLVAAGCRVSVPRAPARVTLSLRGSVHLRAPAPPPAPIVAVVGAPVPEFFGIPLDGAQDVVFVLDCSGSMSDPASGRLVEIATAAPPPPDPNAPPPPPPPPPDPNAPPPPPPDPNAPPPAAAIPLGPRKIDIAQDELVDALARLPAGTRTNVIFFNEGIEAIAPAFVTLDDAGRDGLAAFVRDKLPAGRTALTPAMRIAFLMNARRIVLLSDGLGNVGGNAQALLRDAREAIRGGVRIDTIGLGRDQDVALLRTLAADSGGLYQPL